LSKKEQLESVLGRLKAALPELQEVIIASSDGLPIAQIGTGDTAARVAAMAATANGLGKRIATTTHLGDLAETLVMGSQANFIAYAIGDKAVLALTMPAGSNLGLVRLETQDLVAELATII